MTNLFDVSIKSLLLTIIVYCIGILFLGLDISLFSTIFFTPVGFLVTFLAIQSTWWMSVE